MALPYPDLSRTWDLGTVADGRFFETEFQQLYDNDTNVEARVTALEGGGILQTVYTAFPSAANATTSMPADNTIPQSGEGSEFMTRAITPKSATSILEIEAVAMLCENSNFANMCSGAIFRDATAGALAASSMMMDAGAYPAMLQVVARVVAGSVSATTFKFRAGPDVSGQLNFNSFAGGGGAFGGVASSYMKITEYKA